MISYTDIMGNNTPGLLHAAQVGSGRRLPEHREFRGRCDTGRGCTWIGLEDLSIKKTRLEVQAWKILTLS